MFSQKANPLGDFIRGKEKITGKAGGAMHSVPARGQPDPAQGDIQTLGDFLTRTRLELVPTHVGQRRPDSSFADTHYQSLSSRARYTPIGGEELLRKKT